jgi:hypothetical protein
MSNGGSRNRHPPSSVTDFDLQARIPPGYRETAPRAERVPALLLPGFRRRARRVATRRLRCPVRLASIVLGDPTGAHGAKILLAAPRAQAEDDRADNSRRRDSNYNPSHGRQMHCLDPCAVSSEPQVRSTVSARARVPADAVGTWRSRRRGASSCRRRRNDARRAHPRPTTRRP